MRRPSGGPNGQLLHVLLTYAQVAYQGGHISFVGGKRVLWVYDVRLWVLQEFESSSRWGTMSQCYGLARLV